MVIKSFRIKKKDFERKPVTTFQHKLRVLMRCYTISNLILDEINFSFTFKKNHKINGLRMEDPKEYRGSYEVNETADPKEIVLKLMI